MYEHNKAIKQFIILAEFVLAFSLLYALCYNYTMFVDFCSLYLLSCRLFSTTLTGCINENTIKYYQITFFCSLYITVNVCSFRSFYCNYVFNYTQFEFNYSKYYMQLNKVLLKKWLRILQEITTSYVND